MILNNRFGYNSYEHAIINTFVIIKTNMKDALMKLKANNFPLFDDVKTTNRDITIKAH